jgi:acetyl esterase/lipase
VYNANDKETKPAIVFIHGGALIFGNRESHMIVIETIANAGYTVISIDHRLAPETKLKNIIEDLRDALNWGRNKGPSLFNIDPQRIGVVGNSAGGYLTLMSGFAADYIPKALVSIYGYGDVDGDWYKNPDPFYCSQPLIAEQTARAAIGDKIISETISPHGNRFLFYTYCRQNGIWTKEVTGHDPSDEPAEIFDQFCPIRNITPSYPPTLLVHGDQDTDVSYEKSVDMAKKLAEVGVKHKLVTVPGKGHLFELDGLKDQTVAMAFSEILSFLKLYI